MTVVIPTLAADSALVECLNALGQQTFRNFEVIVVDNSALSATRKLSIAAPGLRIIENTTNAGFGAAINQGWRASKSPWIASLNDDAMPAAGWLESSLKAGESDPRIGTVAAQVRLNDDRLDSAGMLIARDGSSKQRGHNRPPAAYAAAESVLLASGSASLHRRAMLEDTGGFEDSFFLYCEDTDLGLRALWRGWRAVYEPSAVVYHRYSHSAGRASRLKAYYVERNRLALLIRNFPLPLLWRAPIVSVLRYVWHVLYMLRGQGAASEFSRSAGPGALLGWFVLRAHLSAAVRLPVLLKQRRAIRQSARIDARTFAAAVASHSISPREVAAS